MSKKIAMLKQTVRLYGTLKQSVDGYDADKGIDITAPYGTTVEGLIRILGLETKQVGVVFLVGSPAPSHLELKEGVELKIFPPISGG